MEHAAILCWHHQRRGGIKPCRLADLRFTTIQDALAYDCERAIGVISGVLDNVPVEAATLMSNPLLNNAQWSLNALMIGIGGSLTVIGSAAGVIVMSMDKTYSFSTHLKFLPAILTNFFVSLAVWYVQFEIFGL